MTPAQKEFQKITGFSAVSIPKIFKRHDISKNDMDAAISLGREYYKKLRPRGKDLISKSEILKEYVISRKTIDKLLKDIPATRSSIDRKNRSNEVELWDKKLISKLLINAEPRKEIKPSKGFVYKDFKAIVILFCSGRSWKITEQDTLSIDQWLPARNS